MQGAWLRRSHRLRGPRGNLVPAGLAVAGIVVGWRLLSGTYVLFQHAYLGSYWAVPGAAVTSAYWNSVRFAFGQTVLVAVGVGVLGSLAIVELARLAAR